MTKEAAKSISISELKSMRAKLAQSISELILSFERETDVSVREIEIKGVRAGSQRRIVRVGVRLDLDD